MYCGYFIWCVSCTVVVLTCFVMCGCFGTRQRYPYFDVVVGLVRSHDPESYAGGSLATGRVAHARQIKGDDPDKKFGGQ